MRDGEHKTSQTRQTAYEPFLSIQLFSNFSSMTAKDYCSKVCGAKCCKAHEPIVWPLKCPKLTTDNLCSIYPSRIGFKFEALATDREALYGGFTKGTCVCSGPETFVKTLPPEVRAQCCFAHPELLENA